MNIPNIPTDNFYKFIALSGTIIVLVTLYTSITKVSEVEDKLIEAEEIVKTIAVKIESLNRKVSFIDSIIENSDMKQNDKIFKHVGKIELEYSPLEMKELLKEEQEALFLIKIEQVKSEANNKSIEHLHKRASSIFYVGIFIIIIGLLMANIGFTLWYVRVQRPLDMALQNELSNYKSNNAPNQDAQ